MIHVSLAIDNNHDKDGHGPNFQRIMQRINMEKGANISVTHNFDNEIALYDNRLWRCNGK